jgi:hypothetical protein
MIDPPPELRVVRSQAAGGTEVAEPRVVDVVVEGVGAAVVTEVVGTDVTADRVGEEATTAVKGR